MDTQVRGRAAAAAGTGPDASAAADAALADVAGVLKGTSVSLAVVFLGGEYADEAELVRSAVHERLNPDVLVGVTAQGVVAGPTEMESGASLSVWAAALPEATFTPMRFPAAVPGEASVAGPEVPGDARALMLFADPFTFVADELLTRFGDERPGLPVMGGLASGSPRPGGNRLLLDSEVHRDGAVGVVLSGDVAVGPLVSQGCRPVGPDFVVTRAERNLIFELAGRPPAERIQQVYDQADDRDRRRMLAGLHIGLVVDEYSDHHETGDFLVRSVLGADPDLGAIAVGDLVNVGQTVRFHLRDADSADEELRRMLGSISSPPVAALLFTCNGRGSRLFGRPDHDAELVSEALGGAPLAGFFAAGELGPIGSRSHLHGFTASLLTISSGTTAA